MYLLVTIVSLVFLFYNWRRRWVYYYGAKINGPSALPIIGCAHHFLDYKEGLHDKLVELCQKYGPIMRVWLGPLLFIFLTHPKHVEKFMNACLKKGDQYKFAEPFLGHGLLTAPVEKWKKHRMMMNPLFAQKNLNQYFEIFAKNIKFLIEKLEQNGSNSINIFPVFYENSSYTASEIILGKNVCSLEEIETYFGWVKNAESLSVTRFYNPLYHIEFFWKISAPGRNMQLLTKKMWNFVEKVVESQVNVKTSERFLAHLLTNNWNKQEIIDEIQTLLIASSETTSVTQSYLLLMLAIHPDVQNKAYREICEIFDNDRNIVLEDLQKMVFLERVIKETMRLFPARPAIFREVEEDLVLDCQIIPKNSTVFVPISCIHRDPKLWTNPLQFDPDRFDSEEIKKVERFAYMPFSVGPRNCIGPRFSMLTMKINISTILRHYEIISCPYKSVEDIKLAIDTVLMAAEGFKINLRKRN